MIQKYLKNYTVPTKIIPYEEALEKSKKYFNGSQLEAEVFLDKYALKDSEGNLYEATPDDMHKRIAHEITRIENKYPNPRSYEEVLDSLKEFKYLIPQGSPMAGIGNPFQLMSLSNCFVQGNESDSYSGIMRTDEQLAHLMKRRAGVGVDISHLRPSGMLVNNAAQSSTGAVSFMERFSNTTREVAQSGRRGALLESISGYHPDVEQFIDIKMDATKVTGANVSVRMPDEFMEAVARGDTSFTLRFPVESSPEDALFTKKVNPQDMWKKIIKNAWARAEPGLMFWDTIIRESIPDCYADLGYKTISTNPSFRGTTRVATSKGIFPIAELDGKNLMVKNIFGDWKPAKAFKSGTNKELYKITFSNAQEVFCTKEHRWPILYSQGHVANKQTGKLKKRYTVDLKRGDKIYLPTFENSAHNEDSTLTYEDGLMAGFLKGDGWISDNLEGRNNIYGFTINEDDVDTIGSFIKDKLNSMTKQEVNLSRDHGHKSFVISSSDAAVRDYFENTLQVIRKEKGISESIWKSSSDCIKGFITGLFSTDGYVGYNETLAKCTIVLTSAHSELIHDVQKMLNFFGIRSNIRMSKVSAKFPNKKDYGKLYTRYDLYISGMHARKFGETFTLVSKNKQKSLDKIVNSTEAGSYTNSRDYLVVKSVEPTGIEEDVYDITVFDDTHTFLMETGVSGNCGEIPLPIGDSCRLLAINLYSFVDNPFTDKAQFNWKSFREQVTLGQRLMDDIVDLELEHVEAIIEKVVDDPEPDYIKRVELETWQHIKEMGINGRRTGFGITALGDMLAALGFKYGTPEANAFVDNVMRFKKHVEYESSIQLAKERGPFPIWDWEREKDNPFLKRIQSEDPVIYEELSKHGRRNIAISTIAPTGTVSMMARTSSGIENVFLVVYYRSKKVNPNDKNVRVDYVDEVGDSWQEYPVFHPHFKTFLKVKGLSESDIESLTKEEIDGWIKKSPYYGALSNDVDWVQKVEMQGLAQKHVDHSISVTVNLPEDIPVEKVHDVYMTAWRSGCKGITVYRDGSRTGVLNTKSKKVAEASDQILHTNAPKRPKVLKGDVYHVTAVGERWTVVVGLLGDDPYEVFAVKGEIGKHRETGQVKRVKRGHYDLLDEQGNILAENFAADNSDEEASLARLISTSLRHGAKIDYVVEQLNKNEGSIVSFSKAISRTLKKYATDEERVAKLAEEAIFDNPLDCPNDGKGCVVQWDEGCPSCLTCGTSKCT